MAQKGVSVAQKGVPVTQKEFRAQKGVPEAQKGVPVARKGYVAQKEFRGPKGSSIGQNERWSKRITVPN